MSDEFMEAIVVTEAIEFRDGAPFRRRRTAELEQKLSCPIIAPEHLWPGNVVKIPSVAGVWVVTEVRSGPCGASLVEHHAHTKSVTIHPEFPDRTIWEWEEIE